MSGIGALMLAAGLGALSVTATPPTVSAGGTTSTGHMPAVTAIVSGGSGSFTYAWSVNPPPASADSPSAAASAFTCTGIPHFGGYAGTATCLVTDTVTGLTATVDVFIYYYRST